MDLPLKITNFTGRTPLYMVCTANKPSLCALLELLCYRVFLLHKSSEPELWPIVRGESI